MNMEKNGLLLLRTAVGNEIASRDEAHIQSYIFH